MPRWLFIVLAICAITPSALAAPTAPPIPTAPYENQPLGKPPTDLAANNAGSPDKTGDASKWPQWFQVILALALVVGLILVLRPLLVKLSGAGQGASTRTVQVLGTQIIAPRQRVYLLRVGQRLLVVANNGAAMSTLCEITDADEVAAILGQLAAEKSAPKRAFSAALKWARRQQPDEQEEPPEVASDTPSAAVQSADGEIGGLMEKVRQMSKQFR